MTERFMDAVLSLRYQQLEALLRQGVTVDTRNRQGQTPAMVACYVPDEDKAYRMFKFLQKRGADILASDGQRTSVFQHACRRGRERIARRIVREAGVAGADLGGANRSGRSPLFDAVSSGNKSLVRFLVGLMKEKSLCVDTPDSSGVTPLIQAHKLGHADVAAILERDGRANPRICDGERHMNAAEWAEEAARRRLKAQALHKERAREHRMIYSRNTSQRLQPVLPSLPTAGRRPSLPDIVRPMWHAGTMKTKSDTIGGKNWNGDSQKIAERNSNSWVVRKSLEVSSTPSTSNSSVANKSVDTAMTMLELASQTSDRRSFAKSFISSEFDKSKAGEYVSLQRLASVNSLLETYSSQFSSTFRKPVIKPSPPAEPIPASELPDAYEKKSSASTLAYIMGHAGPTPKARRGSKREPGSQKAPVRRKQLQIKGTTTSRRSSVDRGAGVSSGQGTDDASDGGHPKKVARHRKKSVYEPPEQLQGLPSDSDETGAATDQTQDNEGRATGGGRKEDQNPRPKGKSDRLPKLQPTRLSRVPEDDQGQSELPMPQSLNPRDSLPSIRVTIPSH